MYRLLTGCSRCLLLRGLSALPALHSRLAMLSGKRV
jgi:hypothetical protein